METHTKLFVRMKKYHWCSYGYFCSFAVPAIDIGYFCSHVGVGVSDTLADRSGQQYFCIVIVIGYSRSCDTIDIGGFSSNDQGICRLRTSSPRPTPADGVRLV